MSDSNLEDNERPDGRLITLTDPAIEMVLDVRSSENDHESLALWIEVSGSKDDAFTYEIYFQPAVQASRDDWVDEFEELVVVVPYESMLRLAGSTMDVRDGGLVIDNPNTPPKPRQSSPSISGPPPDLSGDVAQRVLQVLDVQINPSIAAHGGHAELVAVEGSSAYLRLSGGCAGCGMAAVTLSQGIEVAIFDAVPEITEVVDVTDHASGTNPYYEAAKK